MRILCLILVLAASPGAQQLPKSPASLPEARNEPTTPSPIEKLDATTYRIGEMTIDTRRKELLARGSVNDVTMLEFVANTPGGVKAYESALTLNTNAVSFNAALLVLGLDPARGKPAPTQFDRRAPEGDPVELTVSWTDGRRERKVAIEELLYDQRTNRTLRKGPWVYTGSGFTSGINGVPIFLAESDGVLIGFMHGPQAVIDNPRNDALGGFGYVMLNPKLKLTAGTPVTLKVKVLPRNTK